VYTLRSLADPVLNALFIAVCWEEPGPALLNQLEFVVRVVPARTQVMLAVEYAVFMTAIWFVI